ncbi:nitrous oxide reductase accessory protein NosL [Halobaculum sp. MBLA0143]|uniref:nitrous oxide reductase accessory protein NosL n=1 Tax=Halobaculum sp. MBLA0143 TaxID=3079933 RepID=UPI00352349BB
MDRTRREFLYGSVVAGVAVTGCLGRETAPGPVAAAGDTQCAQCGMVAADQPGPAGQTVYGGDDEPTEFCSAVCTYRHRFRQAETDPRVTYLTDYSTVDYEVSGSPPVVSAHLDPAAFADANDLSLVVDAEVEGAMGPALVPFSATDDAEAFVNSHGGEVIDTGDVTRTLVSNL